MLVKDIVLVVISVILSVLLQRIASGEKAQFVNGYRVFYLVPLAICVVHMFFFGSEKCMAGVYIGAVFLMAGFFTIKVSVRKNVSIIAIVCMLLTLVPCNFYTGYRCPDFVEDFETGFACMKEHYSLSMHKEIDWDMLYDKYLPQFEAAEQTHDKVANYIAWNAFCAEFCDGHVAFSAKGNEKELEELKMEAGAKQFGNDYGLALVRIDSGEVVAVNVDKDCAAYQAGIRNGTVITLWDEKTMEELENLVDFTFGTFGDIENQEFYKIVAAAGQGGDSVNITYISGNGEEQNVSLQKTGSYYKRFQDTCYQLLGMDKLEANLSWNKVNDTTARLVFNNMVYDSESMENGDFSEMMGKLRDSIYEMKEQGIENLVIDLRNNPGGHGQMSMAIASLFADGEQFWAYDGNYNKKTGEYEVAASNTIQGENLWEGGKIVVLVSAASNSACDHLAYGMGKMDNVTIMGLTKSAGSAQGVLAVPLKSGSLAFSGTILLDEEKEIWIDSDKSKISKAEMDVKVPLTKDAVCRMFDNGEDYVMQYAIDYMKD